MNGKELGRLRQNGQPAQFDALRVQIVALTQRQVDRGIQPRCDVRVERRRFAGLGDPAVHQFDRAVFVVRADQGTQELAVGVLVGRILGRPRFQSRGQVSVPALLPEQFRVRVLQRLLFVWQPTGLGLGRCVQPSVGRVVLARRSQRPRVLLLQVGVVRILLGQAAFERQGTVALAGRPQIARAARLDRFRRLPMRRLPLIDGLQHVQQRQHLVRFEDPAGAADQMFGQVPTALVVAGQFLRLGQQFQSQRLALTAVQQQVVPYPPHPRLRAADFNRSLQVPFHPVPILDRRGVQG
jgi:hypothetical protein